MVTLAVEILPWNYKDMFKKIKDLYQQYKPYVRVDLIMYGVLILLIILYFIITVAID